MFYRWVQRNTGRPAEEPPEGMDPLIWRVLQNRGVPAGGVEAFLNPSVEQLHDPSLLRNADLAAQRIARALRDRETLLIHGDYDVDGVSALALLYRNLKALGAHQVIPYIPDRFDEGYGVSRQGIDRALEAGARLVITVDCGIKAHEEVAYALEHGLEVIVTDHHEPGEPLPFPTLVLNPKLGEYPFAELAGVGVVFKLLQALYRHLGQPETRLLWDLDLVALGTIADQVPLVDENRVFAALGLKVLARTKKAGLKALKQIVGLRDAVDTWHVAFLLAPRLNAAGRMTHAQQAFQLLTTTEGLKALELAQALDAQNRERQKIEQETVAQAAERIEAEGWHLDPILVVEGEGWHEGVIGIVASRLTERYWRPALVIALQGEVGKGSARSIPGFHLYRALAAQEDLFESFGGHTMAAGFRIRRHRIPELRERLKAYAAEHLAPDDLVPWFLVDGEVNPEDLESLDLDLYRRLAPFGMGNPTPVFLLRGVRIVGQVKQVGQDHLVFTVERRGRHFRVFAPRAGWLQDLLRHHVPVQADLAVTVEEDRYSRNRRVRLKLRDLRIHWTSPPASQGLLPPAR